MARNIKRFNIDIKMLCRACEELTQRPLIDIGPGRCNKNCRPCNDVKNVYWANDYSWIMLKGFLLPQNFKQSRTNVLILIPDNYGFGGYLNDVFVDPNLEVRDRAGGQFTRLESANHVFKRFPYSSLSEPVKEALRKQKWLYLCLHSRDANSSLLDYIYKVRLFLGNPHVNFAAFAA